MFTMVLSTADLFGYSITETFTNPHFSHTTVALCSIKVPVVEADVKNVSCILNLCLQFILFFNYLCLAYTFSFPSNFRRNRFHDKPDFFLSSCNSFQVSSCILIDLPLYLIGSFFICDRFFL